MQTALRRDRADRARGLRMLEEILDDTEEEVFQASKEWSGLQAAEGMNDEEPKDEDEFVEHVEKDGTRYLWTQSEYALVTRKQAFLLVLKSEQEARDGVFHDSQVVLVETSPIRLILRESLTPETCRKRLGLIADKEGYDAERSWLIGKLM